MSPAARAGPTDRSGAKTGAKAGAKLSKVCRTMYAISGATPWSFAIHRAHPQYAEKCRAPYRLVAGHKGRLQVPPALLVGAAALLPYLGSAVCQDDVKLCSHAQQHSAGAQAYFLVLENTLALIMQTEASVRCTAGHTRSAGRRRSPGLHARTRAAGVLPARALHQC